jgi:urease accessory protein
MTGRHGHGRLQLAFECDGSGRTQLIQRSHRFPLRITVPMYLDPDDPGAAFVYVQNPAGAVFADDDLAITIEVGPRARVHLTTQSATKIYRVDAGAGAIQRMQVSVGAGASVEVVPDMLIPHAGARYRQHLDVELGDGATFIATERVAPGRLARGERFAYDRVELRTAVWRESRLICCDSLRLEPATIDRPLAGYAYLGSVLSVTPGRAAEPIAHRISQALIADPDVLGGADVLPVGAGVLARVLAHSSAAVTSAVEMAWRLLRGGRLPPVRK